LRRGFDDAVEALNIDIVTSHGIGRPSDAVDPVDRWDAVIETNLTATFELCRRAGRIMLDRGSGKIVNVVVARFQDIAFRHMPRQGRRRQPARPSRTSGRRRCGVNAIAPGYVKTNLTTTSGATAERRSRSSRASPPAVR
jgi:2-deoxy-D-gluconate 3-dehydrogenase